MAQIVEYEMVTGNPPVALGVVDSAGLELTNVTTSATAANTDLNSKTRYVEVRAMAKAINVAIGVGVTATANSLLIAANAKEAFALPAGRSGTWRVSIIDD